MALKTSFRDNIQLKSFTLDRKIDHTVTFRNFDIRVMGNQANPAQPPKFDQYHFYRKVQQVAVSFVYDLKDFTSNTKSYDKLYKWY